MRLTVFTPTYNRAYILSRCYESLLNQTCKDFKWVVIDDGSTDNTADIVKSWKEKDNGFEIEYVYKKNGGMHTAYNVAFDHIDTELCVCIDSDDALTKEAVDKIIKFWDKNKSNEKLVGFAGLDAFFNGEVFGKDLKDVDGQVVPFLELRRRGDKKYVFRSEIIKKYNKYPEFEGENLVPLGTLYYEMNQEYDFLAYNEILANIEYMDDGSTKNIFKQYRRSPQGFAYSKAVYLKYEKNFFRRLKLCAHYIACCLLSKGKAKCFPNDFLILSIVSFPLGLCACLYIMIRSR